jgi:hypothetical protein
MATSFPSSLDSFTNPSASDALDSVSVPHADQHANLNDAMEAVQAKLGVGAGTIGTWTSYTPTLVQSGTVAKTVVVAEYTKINGFVSVFVRLNVTATGTAGQGLKVGLPVAATNTNISAGQASIFDSSTGTMYNGFAFTVTTTEVYVVGDWADIGVWGTIPTLAIASGDVIWMQLNYKVA